MAANTISTALTLYIEHDGDFSGAHVVGDTADVFSRVLAAHVGQHQGAVHHLVSPRQRRAQLGPGDYRGWETYKGKLENNIQVICSGIYFFSYFISVALTYMATCHRNTYHLSFFKGIPAVLIRFFGHHYRERHSAALHSVPPPRSSAAREQRPGALWAPASFPQPQPPPSSQCCPRCCEPCRRTYRCLLVVQPISAKYEMIDTSQHKKIKHDIKNKTERS